MDFDPAGMELWASINEIFDFTDEPARLHILMQACRVADLIAELDEAATQGPLTVRGSMQQPVISPLIAEARAQRSLLHQLLSKLGLPDTEEMKDQKAQKLSTVRANAAKARLKVAK